MSIASVSLAIGMSAAPVLASEAEAPPNPVAFSWVPFVAALVIFGLVFAVLAKAVWPKILTGLDDRAKKIREEIFAAEASRKKAAEAQAQHMKELAEAKAEAMRMIDQTRAEQTRLAADLRIKAEAEATQLRESAMAGIEAAKRAAIADIYSHATELATSCASQILRRELNPTDQARLVEETMGRVKKEYVRG